MSLVPDIGLVFKLNGKRKELSYRKIPFSVWSELKAQLGFTPLSVIEAMGQMDQEALGAIIWLERKQRERNLRWSEIRRDLEAGDVEFEIVGVIVDGKVDSGDEAEVRGTEPVTEEDPTPASV